VECGTSREATEPVSDSKEAVKKLKGRRSLRHLKRKKKRGQEEWNSQKGVPNRAENKTIRERASMLLR